MYAALTSQPSQIVSDKCLLTHPQNSLRLFKRDLGTQLRNNGPKFPKQTSKQFKPKQKKIEITVCRTNKCPKTRAPGSAAITDRGAETALEEACS